MLLISIFISCEAISQDIDFLFIQDKKCHSLCENNRTPVSGVYRGEWFHAWGWILRVNCRGLRHHSRYSRTWLKFAGSNHWVERRPRNNVERAYHYLSLTEKEAGRLVGVRQEYNNRPTWSCGHGHTQGTGHQTIASGTIEVMPDGTLKCKVTGKGRGCNGANGYDPWTHATNNKCIYRQDR